MALPPADSRRSSADPPAGPRRHSSSDAERTASSGAEHAAGSALQTGTENLRSAGVWFISAVLNVFAVSLGGDGEELHVGKISFAPLEVLGHGTAGTFVFR